MNTEQATTEPVKVCRYGGHDIDENDRFYTFYTVVDGRAEEDSTPNTYACEKHETEHKVEEFLKDRVLRTSLMVTASLARDRRRRDLGLRWDEPYTPSIKLWFDHFMDDYDRVDEAFKLWEREVWFGGQTPHLDDAVTKPYADMPEFRQYIDKKKGAPAGSLQAFVIPAKWHGYRADMWDGVTYLSYTIAGRSIFQIDAPDVSLGYCLDETSPTPRGGIQSLSCTADRAVTLITRAIADWKDGKVTFAHSDAVGF